MIKAVIFDMDGLLVDSEPSWIESKIKVFTKINSSLNREIAEEIAKGSQGLRINEIVDYWFSDYWFSRFSFKEEEKRKIADKLTAEVVSRIKENGKTLPGAEEIVKIFASANIPMAIASSSAMKIIDAVLEKVPVRDYIKVIYSAEFEKYGKPHPGIYISTAEKLGVRVENCLAFEDSPNGVLSAKAAKMRCVAVPNQYVKGDKRFAIADMVIDSLLDFKLEDLKKF